MVANQTAASAVNLTLGDFVGYTTFLEGVLGVDSTTGDLLGAGDRWLRGTVGAAQMIASAVGGAELIHAGRVALAGGVGATKAVQADFYVRPNGDVIPARGYHHMASDSPYTEAVLHSGVKRPPPGDPIYATFDKIDDFTKVKPELQLTHDGAIRFEFDTFQVLDDIRIPHSHHNFGDNFEAITSSYPRFGAGGRTQFITDRSIKLKKAVDTRTGKVLREF